MEHPSQQMLVVAVALVVGAGVVHMGVTEVVALGAGAGALPGPKRLGLGTGPAPTATTYVLPAGNGMLMG